MTTGALAVRYDLKQTSAPAQKGFAVVYLVPGQAISPSLRTDQDAISLRLQCRSITVENEHLLTNKCLGPGGPLPVSLPRAHTCCAPLILTFSVI